MIPNLKLTVDSALVDPSSYRHLIGSIMYLVNNQPDIHFAVNNIGQSPVHGLANTDSHNRDKACALTFAV